MTILPPSHPEDVEQILRDVRTRIDATTFRLNQQFMRAHGAPRGELTTLDRGVFLSKPERRQ